MSEQQNIIIPDQETLPIDKAVATLRKAIYTCTESIEGLSAGLYTFSQPIPGADPLRWLVRQNLFPRVFWMNREKNFTLAGIGSADRIELDAPGSNRDSFERLVSTLAAKGPSVRSARYLGGFRFNNREKQDETWDGFPSFCFVLPLVQLTVEDNAFQLTCHLRIENKESVSEKRSQLLDALDLLDTGENSAEEQLPEMTGVTCIPDRELWTDCCRQALALFESGTMDKIMLARRTLLEFSSGFSPLLYLLHYPYPKNPTYRFYFEPEKNRAFISFTPERLYRRDGQVILTEALAGTCMKESLNGSDLRASEMLLNSEKDIREHGFVKDTIYRELQPISSSIEMEEKLRVLQLNRLAHLYTRCTATLKPEYCSDSMVLSLLHPTPAVGGVPREEAMQHIMNLEPFCRGWYAAPAGWISRDSAEFCVGIRSALVNAGNTNLYSGAGLVKGSNPDLEWEEVEQKIGDIMAITSHSA
ncbi:MAG: isochorismate synthase [Chlorobium sp.]|uniref:isochorismate synthase n=1 Tax=Chlorobium sp. TaxID=1095 RepID=UPI0025BC58B7|nr:isochorismate synthase [Chlorobium sp.]MCF8382996.1 isochorismate synthase [Chlorobium sp.]